MAPLHQVHHFIIGPRFRPPRPESTPVAPGGPSTPQAGRGELPQHDNEPAGEPEGRGRGGPGGAWGQLSEGARDELTRPLRVESGRAGSPGEGQPQWQPDLRQGGPRLPEPGEEPAEGGGEPRTIERPRVRARLADQGERARPPWEGWRHDLRPPSSPGETPAGPSTLSEAAVPVEGEAESRPQPRKRHQKRLQRQSGNARKASKGPGRAEGSPRQAKEGTLGPESGGRT